jgi:hypothetical protein
MSELTSKKRCVREHCRERIKRTEYSLLGQDRRNLLGGLVLNVPYGRGRGFEQDPSTHFSILSGISAVYYE